MGPEIQRTLTNPPVRREIRPDFPETILSLDSEEISRLLEQELAKYGSSLGEVGHITLAYPHKHPELWPNHLDEAKYSLEGFLEATQREPALAAIDWLTADGLVETKRLGRSENKTSAHALMVNQIYDIHKPSQTTPLPFLEREGREFFVIIDHTLSMGTTVANMMSYIEHNGGTVLAVAHEVFSGGVDIAQGEDKYKEFVSNISPRFNDEARNTGSLPELGHCLCDCAKKEGLGHLTPERCLELLEEGLNKHGNSVYAMTGGNAASS